jgi:hypothetical protein
MSLSAAGAAGDAAKAAAPANAESRRNRRREMLAWSGEAGPFMLRVVFDCRGEEGGVNAPLAVALFHFPFEMRRTRLVGACLQAMGCEVHRLQAGSYRPAY